MKDFLFPNSVIDAQQKNSELKEKALQGVKIIGLECGDAAIKWAPRFAEMDHIAILRTAAFELGNDTPNITIIADARPDRQAVFIHSGDHEGLGFHNLTNPDTFDLPLPGGEVEISTGLVPYIQHKEPGFISWDVNLTLDDVAKVVRALDINAGKEGLFDERTKVRKPIPVQSYVPLPKFKVEEVFNEIGMAQPLLGEKNPESLLDQFDHPEELMIRNNSFLDDLPSIVAKRDASFLDKKDQVALVVLEKFGFTPQDVEEGLIRAPEVFNPLIMKIRAAVIQKSQNLLQAESLRRLPISDDDPVFIPLQTGLINIYESESLDDIDLLESGESMLDQLLSENPERSDIPHAYGVAISNTTRDLERVFSLFKLATERQPKKARHFYDAAMCVLMLDNRPEKYNEALELFKSAQSQEDNDEYLNSLTHGETLSIGMAFQEARRRGKK